MISKTGNRWLAAALGVALACGAVPAAHAEPLESQRLERAKDFIADEQWLRAITELRAAAADPKETQKDEALFWLAHSQNQVRQHVAALETIGRLERAYPLSRWLRPAQSLSLEIAQRLGRRDVLWYTARPAPPPPPPPAPPSPPRFILRSGEAGMPSLWVAQAFSADQDLRIQALGSLISTDAEQVIPILKEIALDGSHPEPARRALFVLAQSGRPEAQSTVVEVARTGPESVRIAAVRELGRLEGTRVATDLLQVYSTADTPVRYQVVSALGERAATAALLRIVEQERNPQLREVAITTLGTAGGREQLNVLYARSSADVKRLVIAGFFNARAEDDLIRIARTDRDPALRQEAIGKLRIMGTPAALRFLKTVDRQ